MLTLRNLQPRHQATLLQHLFFHIGRFQGFRLHSGAHERLHLRSQGSRCYLLHSVLCGHQYSMDHHGYPEPGTALRQRHQLPNQSSVKVDDPAAPSSFSLPKMPTTGEATSTMSFQSTQASVVGLNDPSTTSSVTSTPSSRGSGRMVLGGSGVTYFLMGITALTSSNWLSNLDSC